MRRMSYFWQAGFQSIERNLVHATAMYEKFLWACSCRKYFVRRLLLNYVSLQARFWLLDNHMGIGVVTSQILHLKLVRTATGRKCVGHR